MHVISPITVGLAGLVAVGATRCSPPVDYGQQICDLRKPAGDGGTVLVAKTQCGESEQKSMDLIAFGATECENLICLHTAKAPASGYRADNPNCGGYCSTGCLSNDDCKTDDPRLNLVCRELLLDQEFLGRLGDGGFLPPNAPSRYCSFR